MQRQTIMFNLFVEFGIQLFNMKTLFYFRLRICAGMIDNLKTRNIALILTPFRSTRGRIALEPDILNVPGQTPQDLALSLSADNLSVVHAPSH